MHWEAIALPFCRVIRGVFIWESLHRLLVCRRTNWAKSSFFPTKIWISLKNNADIHTWNIQSYFEMSKPDQKLSGSGRFWEIGTEPTCTGRIKKLTAFWDHWSPSINNLKVSFSISTESRGKQCSNSVNPFSILVTLALLW